MSTDWTRTDLEANLDASTDVGADADTPGAPDGAYGWSESAEVPLRPVDRYVFVGEYARGGLRVVHEAIDRETGRRVAIKQLLASSPRSELRFRREALTTAQLEHPNVVAVYDIGRWEDTHELFYSMKMVRGRSLKQAIAEAGDLEQRLGLLPFVVAAAEAVAFAHSRRIIHRDLKPANVLVGDYGETVVIDWGLAKSLDSASPTDAEQHEERLEVGPSDGKHGALTRTGHVVGTPAYMPPEQAVGDAVDERADVYALGAMLYQVLTGHAPHSESVRSEQRGHDHTEPVQAREPRVPRELAAIVNRSMATDPDARYRSAGDVVDDLKRFQRGQLIAAHRYSKSELGRRWVARHRGGILAASLIVVSSLAIGGLYRARSADPADACEAAADELTSVWGDGHRRELARVMDATGTPGATQVVGRTLSVVAIIEGLLVTKNDGPAAGTLVPHRRPQWM